MLARLLVWDGTRADLTGGEWTFVLLCALVLVGAAILAVFPIAMANRRRNPQGELILAGSLFWGGGAAWSTLSWVLSTWKWSREKSTLMLEGYYKTAIADPAPRVPWPWWLALAALYVLLLALSLRRAGERTNHPR
jgi:hypothetical protein